MGKKKRSLFYIAHLLWMILLLCATMMSVFASEEIRSIDIDVVLNDDGSAKITQVWDISTHKGTEFYIPMTRMGDMEIIDFKVSDETGKEFTFVENWDTSASIDEKAYKNGFNPTDEGFELCWGKGSYGDHRYTITYTMTNLVKSYPDADGFNTRFVNDKMSPSVERATVRIRRADAAPNESFVAEETGVFAYGFSGYINVIDGEIEAATDQPIDANNHMTILVRLPKGLLHPISIGSGTFQELQDLANEGSDYTPQNDYYDEGQSYGGYGTGNFLRSFLVFNPFVIFFVFAAIFSVFKSGSPNRLLKQYKERAKKDGELNYYRQLPMNGEIDATKFALESGGHIVSKENLMGAYILRLVRQKALRPEKISVPKVFGGEKEEMAFIIDLNVPIEEKGLSDLRDLIVSASGEDGILQEKEMRRWSEKHYKKIEKWFESLDQRGKDKFGKSGGYQLEAQKKTLQSKAQMTLTEKGYTMIRQALGFKKYLDDFTLISEREVKEVELWDDYLVFASLFGIADKVAQQMKKIYPNFVNESEFYQSHMDPIRTLYFANTFNRAINSGYSTGRYQSMGGSRSFGGGGSSSFGGGGGFSGGGSGGGSR